MVKIIQDLWILTESGIVVFNRVFDPVVNVQLFGALMTALDSFAKGIGMGEEGLNSFEVRDVRFTILKCEKLLFIANSSRKIKDKRVLEELKKISHIFFKKYEEILNDFDNWNMEISVFKDFEKDIEDALEEPIKKFWYEFK
ncbi:MAG: hypothetical protein EU539_08490 [Promethearchaeota archaeon]|nr:MAG: hypothetical protein EU539_08490 [Candidatus Lokiarchaeota archaeon]